MSVGKRIYEIARTPVVFGAQAVDFVIDAATHLPSAYEGEGGGTRGVFYGPFRSMFESFKDNVMGQASATNDETAGDSMVGMVMGPKGLIGATVEIIPEWIGPVPVRKAASEVIWTPFLTNMQRMYKTGVDRPVGFLATISNVYELETAGETKGSKPGWSVPWEGEFWDLSSVAPDEILQRLKNAVPGNYAQDEYQAVTLDLDTYADAWKVTESRSAGQAIILAQQRIDIFDKESVKNFEGTLYYQVASGVIDLSLNIMGDPAYLVAKSARSAIGLRKARETWEAGGGFQLPPKTSLAPFEFPPTRPTRRGVPRERDPSFFDKWSYTPKWMDDVAPNPTVDQMIRSSGFGNFRSVISDIWHETHAATRSRIDDLDPDYVAGGEKGTEIVDAARQDLLEAQVASDLADSLIKEKEDLLKERETYRDPETGRILSRDELVALEEFKYEGMSDREIIEMLKGPPGGTLAARELELQALTAEELWAEVRNTEKATGKNHLSDEARFPKRPEGSILKGSSLQDPAYQAKLIDWILDTEPTKPWEPDWEWQPRGSADRLSEVDKRLVEISQAEIWDTSLPPSRRTSTEQFIDNLALNILRAGNEGRLGPGWKKMPDTHAHTWAKMMAITANGAPINTIAWLQFDNIWRWNLGSDAAKIAFENQANFLVHLFADANFQNFPEFISEYRRLTDEINTLEAGKREFTTQNIDPQHVQTQIDLLIEQRERLGTLFEEQISLMGNKTDDFITQYGDGGGVVPPKGTPEFDAFISQLDQMQQLPWNAILSTKEQFLKTLVERIDPPNVGPDLANTVSRYDNGLDDVTNIVEAATREILRTAHIPAGATQMLPYLGASSRLGFSARTFLEKSDRYNQVRDKRATRIVVDKVAQAVINWNNVPHAYTQIERALRDFGRIVTPDGRSMFDAIGINPNELLIQILDSTDDMNKMRQIWEDAVNQMNQGLVNEFVNVADPTTTGKVLIDTNLVTRILRGEILSAEDLVLKSGARTEAAFTNADFTVVNFGEEGSQFQLHLPIAPSHLKDTSIVPRYDMYKNLTRIAEGDFRDIIDPLSGEKKGIHVGAARAQVRAVRRGFSTVWKRSVLMTPRWQMVVNIDSVLRTIASVGSAATFARLGGRFDSLKAKWLRRSGVPVAGIVADELHVWAENWRRQNGDVADLPPELRQTLDEINEGLAESGQSLISDDNLLRWAQADDVWDMTPQARREAGFVDDNAPAVTRQWDEADPEVLQHFQSQQFINDLLPRIDRGDAMIPTRWEAQIRIKQLVRERGRVGIDDPVMLQDTTAAWARGQVDGPPMTLERSRFVEDVDLYNRITEGGFDDFVENIIDREYAAGRRFRRTGLMTGAGLFFGGPVGAAVAAVTYNKYARSSLAAVTRRQIADSYGQSIMLEAADGISRLENLERAMLEGYRPNDFDIRDFDALTADELMLLDEGMELADVLAEAAKNRREAARLLSARATYITDYQKNVVDVFRETQPELAGRFDQAAEILADAGYNQSQLGNAVYDNAWGDTPQLQQVWERVNSANASARHLWNEENAVLRKTERYEGAHQFDITAPNEQSSFVNAYDDYMKRHATAQGVPGISAHRDFWRQYWLGRSDDEIFEWLQNEGRTVLDDLPEGFHTPEGMQQLIDNVRYESNSLVPNIPEFQRVRAQLGRGEEITWAGDIEPVLRDIKAAQDGILNEIVTANADIRFAPDYVVPRDTAGIFNAIDEIQEQGAWYREAEPGETWFRSDMVPKGDAVSAAKYLLTRPVVERMRLGSKIPPSTTDAINTWEGGIDFGKTVNSSEYADGLQTMGYRKRAIKLIDDFVTTRFENLSMVEDTVARGTMFEAVYERAVADNLQRYRNADGSYTVTGDDLKIIATNARKTALYETKLVLYDLAERSRFEELMTELMPFLGAWTEVATRWMGLAAQNPVFVARALRPWHVLTAKDENDQTRLIFTLPDVFDTDTPAAIAKIPFISDKLFGPVSILSKEAMDVNLASASMIGGINLLGPLYTSGATEAVIAVPEMSEFIDWTLPYGYAEGDNAVTRFLDAHVNSWIQSGLQMAGMDTNSRAATAVRVTQDYLAQMHENGQMIPNEPEEMRAFEAEIERRVKAIYGIRMFRSLAVPVSFRQQSPYWGIIADFYKVEDTYGAETADYWLLENHPELWAFTGRKYANNGVVAGTLEGHLKYRDHQDMAEKHPIIGPYIVGAVSPLDTQFEYNRAIRDQELRSGRKEYLDPEGILTEAQEAIGWREYRVFRNSLDNELRLRAQLGGSASLNATSNQDLRRQKNEFVEGLGIRNARWIAEYNEIGDPQKQRKILAAFRDVVADPTFDYRTDREEIEMFLNLYDYIGNQLLARAAANNDDNYLKLSHKGNIDLLNDWDVELLRILQFPDFGPVHDRFFSNMETVSTKNLPRRELVGTT